MYNNKKDRGRSMENQLIEIVQSILQLTQDIHEDRKAERYNADRKFNLVCVICIIIIIGNMLCSTITKCVEIDRSYNYDLSIENKAEAVSGKESTE